MFAWLKDVLFYRIPDEHKVPFESEIFRTNILSAKITALVLLLSSLVLTIVYIIETDYGHILFELIFITFFILTSVYYLILDRLSKNVDKYLRIIKTISCIYVELVLSCAAAFSAYHQDNAFCGILYMALVFVFCYCFYCESVKLLIILGISQTFYLLVTFLKHGISGTLVSSAILTWMYLAVSYILSRLSYRRKFYEYITKAIIQEKNEQLSRLNEELTETNLQLKKLSYTDSLTGLNNRRHMNEILQKEWERCRTEKRPLSLLMIDIDNFKALNDLFGHPVGDDCLQQIAALMKHILDDTGAVLARYGGEEFMVALPCTDESHAYNIAEQLRTGVEKHMFVWRGHGSEIQITISIGVASIVPDDEYSIDDLILSSDKSMYVAKKSKNKTIVLPVQKVEKRQTLKLIAKP